jgi:ankyrin repeat protein
MEFDELFDEFKKHYEIKKFPIHTKNIKWDILKYCVFNASYKILKYFISLGADPNNKDITGKSTYDLVEFQTNKSTEMIFKKHKLLVEFLKNNNNSRGSKIFELEFSNSMKKIIDEDNVTEFKNLNIDNIINEMFFELGVYFKF